MNPRRVLVMTRDVLVPPENVEELPDASFELVKTDYDVINGLRDGGHTVEVLGLGDALPPLRETLRSFRPHVVFNLLEDFGGSARQMVHVLGYLELMDQAYTGCNPAGMLFSTSKALQRKILRYHRIHVPDFMVVRRGQKVRRPPRLDFPLIVKSASAHGSEGISQASVVTSDAELAERVSLVHAQLASDAIAEQFIEGRELYVALLGNHRLETFPVLELSFDSLRAGAPRIMTQRAKWDPAYQEQIGLKVKPPDDLGTDLERRIVRTCRRAYRALQQTGYARVDLRMTAEGVIYVLESNPNPQLSFTDEFAMAAELAGMAYGRLLERIMSLGLRAAAERSR